MSVRALVVAFVVLAVSVAARPAAAQDPNAVFGGRIIMSTKRFPQQAKSKDAYIASVKKLAMQNFVEDKSTGTWKIYFTGFLKSPLDDVEYLVKVYELTGSSQQLLVSFDQYTDTRGERTISSNITLDKKQVGVNKQCLITMESKGKVLASARLKASSARASTTAARSTSPGQDDGN